MRCCSQIINLVVNDGLKDASSSIAKIRHVVRFVIFLPKSLYVLIFLLEVIRFA